MPQLTVLPTQETTRLGQATLRQLLWWVRAIITVALAVYLIWRVRADVGTLHFHLARPLRLALALGCVVLAVMLSVWLWRLLIPPANRVPFSQLLVHYLLGFFWNNFLPSALGGDAVRALALRASSGRTDVAVTSVLMTRVAGLWSIVLLATVVALFHATRVGWQATLPFLLVATGALIVTVGGTTFLLGTPISVLMRRLPERLNDWHAHLRTYGKQPVRLLQALGCALAIQLCAVAINAFTAQALNLAITPGQLLVSIPLINLAAIVPISLGGFGVREGSYLYFLGLVGVGLFATLAVFDRERIDKAKTQRYLQGLTTEQRERYQLFAKQDGGPYDRKTSANILDCIPPSSSAISLAKHPIAWLVAAFLVGAGHFAEGGIYLARTIKNEL